MNAFEKRLGLLIDQKLGGVENEIFFQVAVMRRVLFIRGFWKKFLCWAWAALGRKGAMPVSIRVDWLGWWLFSNGGIGGKICICFV